MQQQLIMIHGGTTFDTYDDYVEFLEASNVSAEKFKTSKHWQNSLDSQLGSEFEVFAPRMPNRNNARYKEWCIWFQKMLPFINDDVTLVGYSLGGVFLAKYLSENTFPKKIKGLVLVGSPMDSVGLSESLGDFDFATSVSDFTLQTGKTYMIFSEDDPVVPYSRLDEYTQMLSKVETITFLDKGHFYQEFFPEIVKLIKNI